MKKYKKIKKSFNKLLKEYIEVINICGPGYTKETITKFKNDWKIKAGFKK